MMMLFLGIVVGGIVISMYLPLFSLIGKLAGQLIRCRAWRDAAFLGRLAVCDDFLQLARAERNRERRNAGAVDGSENGIPPMAANGCLGSGESDFSSSLSVGGCRRGSSARPVALPVKSCSSRWLASGTHSRLST